MFYECGLRVETHYIAGADGVQVTKIVRYAVNYLKCLAFGRNGEENSPNADRWGPPAEYEVFATSARHVNVQNRPNLSNTTKLRKTSVEG